MEIVESLKKDGKLLSLSGFLYRKDRQFKTTINWRCSVKGCKGRLITSTMPDNDDEGTMKGEHCHLPDPTRVEVKKLKTRLIDKAVATVEPPRRIITDEVQTLSQEAAAIIRSNKNLTAIINRKRRKVSRAPPAPISRHGFVVPEEFSVTTTGLRTLSTGSDGPKLQEMVRSVVPPLTSDKYKGQSGRLAIIGGCREYTGAPYFAAISAMKVGADLAHVFCTGDAASVIKSYSPELIVHPILDSDDAEPQFTQWVDRMHAVVVGPGLGRDERVLNTAKNFIRKVLERNLPLVVDADGLWLLTNEPDLICGYSKAILTPNAVEFARLQEAVLGIRPQKDAVFDPDDVIKLSKALGHVTIVRKGKEDVITDGHNMVICDSKGSPRRCGGQGDLLSGSLVTFAHWSHTAYKQSSLNVQLKEYGPSVCAAYASCLLTRLCAESAFQESGRSTTTTDLIRQIHGSFVSLFE